MFASLEALRDFKDRILSEAYSSLRAWCGGSGWPALKAEYPGLRSASVEYSPGSGELWVYPSNGDFSLAVCITVDPHEGCLVVEEGEESVRVSLADRDYLMTLRAVLRGPLECAAACRLTDAQRAEADLDDMDDLDDD